MLATPRRTKAHALAALASIPLACASFYAASTLTARALDELDNEPADESQTILIRATDTPNVNRLFMRPDPATLEIPCPDIGSDADPITLVWIKHRHIGKRLWGVPFRIDRDSDYWIFRSSGGFSDIAPSSIYLDQLKKYGLAWICPSLDNLQLCMNQHAPQAATVVRACGAPNNLCQTSRWLWQAEAACAARLAAIALSATLAYSTIWLISATLIRRARAARGACPPCGYDLRGQSSASNCPECGAITPPDSASRA